jgi:hypothetical protein
MNLRIEAAVGLAFFAGTLAIVGCEPEGVGTVGPPAGTARKDDSFLIPGYNPEAAKALKNKKKGKSARTTPATGPVDLKGQRH